MSAHTARVPDEKEREALFKEFLDTGKLYHVLAARRKRSPSFLQRNLRLGTTNAANSRDRGIRRRLDVQYVYGHEVVEWNERIKGLRCPWCLPLRNVRLNNVDDLFLHLRSCHHRFSFMDISPRGFTSGPTGLVLIKVGLMEGKQGYAASRYERMKAWDMEAVFANSVRYPGYSAEAPYDSGLVPGVWKVTRFSKKLKLPLDETSRPAEESRKRAAPSAEDVEPLPNGATDVTVRNGGSVAGPHRPGVGMTGLAAVRALHEHARCRFFESFFEKEKSEKLTVRELSNCLSTLRTGPRTRKAGGKRKVRRRDNDEARDSQRAGSPEAGRRRRSDANLASRSVANVVDGVEQESALPRSRSEKQVGHTATAGFVHNNGASRSRKSADGGHQHRLDANSETQSKRVGEVDEVNDELTAALRDGLLFHTIVQTGGTSDNYLAEEDSDEDDLVDEDWRLALCDRLITDYADTSVLEMLYMNLWNQYVMREVYVYSDRRQQLAAVEFARRYGCVLTRLNLEVIFVRHLTELASCGLIDASGMHTAVVALGEAKAAAESGIDNVEERLAEFEFLNRLKRRFKRYGTHWNVLIDFEMPNQVDYKIAPEVPGDG